jgi:hypothetical protein
MAERRSAHRYKISAAVVIRSQSTDMALESVHAATRDVSTRGILFTSNQPFAVGTRVGLFLTLPLQVPNCSQLVVKANAMVVRVENSGNVAESIGIAAVIDNYDIVQPKSAE